MKSILTALMVLVLPFQANANLITYNYTGQPFSQACTHPQCPSGLTGLTGTLTVDAPSSDFTGNLTLTSLISFSFSDGVSTITDASGPFDFAVLDLDLVQGEVDEWFLSFIRESSEMVAGDYAGFRTLRNTSNSLDRTTYCYSGGGSPPGTCGSTNPNPYVAAINDETPGTWTRVTQVPEPSTLALLSLGFIGIGAARKLKKH